MHAWYPITSIVFSCSKFINLKKSYFLRLAKKTMFKIAFHGGFSNVWSGVMSIPEVSWAGILKQYMEARNRVGTGLSYRAARLHMLEELSPWN